MPFAQLFTASIELGFNQLLELDPDSRTRLKKLSGRSLQVSIKELPWPLRFHFSDKIDVSTTVEPEDTSAVDCVIELDLETLPKLKDSSQLTQLIQQKKLNLVGDIYVAQSFSNILKELEIDWEEQLSKYTGDVVAHQTFSSAKSFLKLAQEKVEQSSAQFSARMTQADAIAVKPIEAALFSDNVSELRSATERLSARISQLEQARKAPKG